jgi:p-cymene methyl-monooxygenase electron transfer component
VLVFGARTQADLYAQEAIEQIHRGWTGRFTFVPEVSNEPVGSDWTGQRGLIHEQLAQIVGNRAEEAQAYLCGPSQMIDASVAVLQQLGVPGKAIFADKFLDRSSSVKAAA